MTVFQRPKTENNEFSIKTSEIKMFSCFDEQVNYTVGDWFDANSRTLVMCLAKKVLSLDTNVCHLSPFKILFQQYCFKHKHEIIAV